VLNPEKRHASRNVERSSANSAPFRHVAMGGRYPFHESRPRTFPAWSLRVIQNSEDPRQRRRIEVRIDTNSASAVFKSQPRPPWQRRFESANGKVRTACLTSYKAAAASAWAGWPGIRIGGTFANQIPVLLS